MARIVKKPKTLKYILSEDLYDKQPFTLKLKPLSAIQLATLEDKVSAYSNRDGIIYMNNQQFYYSICQHGIVGWQNLVDEDGSEILPDLKNGLLSEESMNYILRDIEEIGGVIHTITKNSDSISKYEEILKKVEEEMKDTKAKDTTDAENKE